MKRTMLMILVTTLVTIAFALPARAETYTAVVPLTPANEVPPIAGLTASGITILTINVVRDASGNIVTGSVNFLTSYNFSGTVTLTGHHIHEGSAAINAGVVINTGISGASPIVNASGVGTINDTVTGVSAALMGRILVNPAGFYVNLHTSINPGGAIRGQLTNLVEVLSSTVALSTASEVPPITTVNASGIGTITVLPTRNPVTGVITGGLVNFSVNYTFPGAVTFTGLHIHQSPVGVNGNVVINTGLSGVNTVVSSTGTGSVTYNVPNVSATLIQGLVTNPAGFYVNLHSTINPGGVVRGQMIPLATPPVIGAVLPSVVQTGSSQTLTLLGTRFSSVAAVFINGQPVSSIYDGGNTPQQLTGVQVPAALLASAGTLNIQVQDFNGLMSPIISVPVAALANLNATPAVTVDAARYGASVAPESIAAVFGTTLATANVSATSTPLPIALDGTSVYVNGFPAPLFFVSPGQINYQIPPGIPPGAAAVVVVNKNGIVSQGGINVVSSIAAIFTIKSDGTGAPAAVASTDGATFNIPVGNPDGTPTVLDPGVNGLFVSLFGTGFRYAPNTDTNAANGAAESVSITIGGTAVPTATLFAGAQGTLIGVDQINFKIPASFAGKGLVDLIVTIDGKASNTMKLNIK